jgi:hypothetical protein
MSWLTGSNVEKEENEEKCQKEGDAKTKAVLPY